MQKIKSTTILSVRRGKQVAIGGDGQVTLGNVAVKHGAKKIRKVYNDRVLLGFAGSASDALALYEKLENKLEQYRGNLRRAAVETSQRLAKRSHSQTHRCLDDCRRRRWRISSFGRRRRNLARRRDISHRIGRFHRIGSRKSLIESF